MKTLIKLTATAAGIALLAGMSGCADSSPAPSSGSPSASAGVSAGTVFSEKDIAALKTVTFADAEGGKPVITVPSDLVLTGPAAVILREGDGEAIKEGDQISLDLAQYTIPGAALVASSFDGSAAQQAVQYSPAKLNPDILELLAGKKVGTVFALAQKISAETETENVQFGLTVAKVAGISKVYTRAEGKAVTPPKGLPSVSLDAKGAPTIKIPKGFKPSGKLVSEYLIEGNGPVVPQGASITVNYLGVLLNGTQFDSSWARGETASFSLTGVVQGWGQGLAGKKVGSQVLLVVPPDLGYGSEANGKIPANSTLVFVVDILALG
ncbi:MAG: FKBP-type peptidyl-prolyl cis-trans isomerase [Propionibacteriaceae bacterium]|jgi:peptidylprolyl isomerase|nr:FKBP-type peptidyl-prolyl cis-trans isomerase [Propionibacteriaceae bacterium]